MDARRTRAMEGRDLSLTCTTMATNAFSSNTRIDGREFSGRGRMLVRMIVRQTKAEIALPVNTNGNQVQDAGSA